jgi:hypothetical protein
MDKPPTDRTTVTVKGLSIEAWEQAKKAAIKRGETQGEWLGRACLHLANLESGDAVLAPGKPDHPPASAGDLQAFAAVLQGMGTAGVKPTKRVASKVNRLLDLQLASALPPPPPRRSPAPPALPAPTSKAAP